MNAQVQMVKIPAVKDASATFNGVEYKAQKDGNKYSLEIPLEFQELALGLHLGRDIAANAEIVEEVQMPTIASQVQAKHIEDVVETATEPTVTAEETVVATQPPATAESTAAGAETAAAGTNTQPWLAPQIN